MLARAAVTPEHLPASHSMFLSRLIQARTKPPRPRSKPSAPATETALEDPTSTGEGEYDILPLGFEEMDYAAFGLRVEADDTATMWPPLPPGFSLRVPPEGPAPQANGNQEADGEGQKQSTDATRGATDLATWVAQQNANFTLPGPALGLGVGSFGGDGGVLLNQDSFWQSILSSGAPPGMV